jgi:hypothetical protein
MQPTLVFCYRCGSLREVALFSATGRASKVPEHRRNNQRDNQLSRSKNNIGQEPRPPRHQIKGLLAIRSTLVKICYLQKNWPGLPKRTVENQRRMAAR